MKLEALSVIIGILAGAFGASMILKDHAAPFPPAQPIAPYELGVFNGNQVAAAWRMNKVTGTLEACMMIQGEAKCYLMPHPSN